MALLLIAGFVLAGALASAPQAREVAELAVTDTGWPAESPSARPEGSGSNGPESTAPPAGGTAGAPAAVSDAAGAPAGPVPRTGGNTGADSELVVHVAGAVIRPGIVRVPAGARAADAVAAAGGLAEDAHPAGVNLAAPLADGTMLVVPRRDEVVALPPAAAGGADSGDARTGDGPGGTAPGALVNLNTADAAQLQELPRVGPVLAERILSWRNEHGGFASVDDLDAVPGIGEAMMASLRSLVTV